MILKSKNRTPNLIAIIIVLLFLNSCNKDEINVPNPNNIYYKAVGQSISSGSPLQIELDVNNDGVLDFLVFSVITSDQEGEHLYFGIKPISDNMIKTGLPNDNLYLGMGFIESENLNEIINNELKNNQIWTSSRNTLVVKHTENNTNIWYEGPWKNDYETIMAIKHVVNHVNHYGWLRLKLDKIQGSVTLVDYAYNLNNEKSIKAGQKKSI